VAGEQWLQVVQVGKETTPGTAVVASRRLYVAGDFSRQRAVNLVEVNTVRSDNRIANLREATYFENAQNIRRASVRNKSGLLGVSPHKSGMWRARIMKDGKSRVTWHHTPEAAHAAYIALKTELHPFSTLGPLGRQGSTHDNSSR
jgi:hypothetical protein